MSTESVDLIIEAFDRRIERIKALGLDDGDLVVADLWKVRCYALATAAGISQSSVLPVLVESVQWAVAQINEALSDSRVQQSEAALAWLRTINEGLCNSTGDVEYDLCTVCDKPDHSANWKHGGPPSQPFAPELDQAWGGES